MLIMQIPSILTKNLFEIFCRGILMGQIKPNINGMVLLGFPFQEIYWTKNIERASQGEI